MRESKCYYSGNPEHSGLKRIYLTNARDLQRLLLNGDIHVFKWDFRCEWISDRPLRAGEFRIKLVVDSGKVYADNNGIYRLT